MKMIKPKDEYDGQTVGRGIPTQPDVERLIAKYGVPEEEDVITRDEIAKFLKISKDSKRFDTVTAAWRSRLYREHNLLSYGDGQGGIVFANPSARVEWSARRVANGRRLIGRAIRVAYDTDAKRLTADEKRVCESIAELNVNRLKLAESVMR